MVLFVTSAKLWRLVAMSKACDGVYGSTSSEFNVRPGYLGIVRAVYSLTTQDHRQAGGPDCHLVEDLASSAGFEIRNPQPRIVVPKKLIARTRRKFLLPAGKPIVTINPGPTWAVRNWPASYWRQLIKMLHELGDFEIIQVGLKQKRHPSAFDELERVIPLMSKLRVDELAAVIAMSRLVISIDSGPIHLAGAVGTPVLGLFGAINPALRLPPESPALALHANVPCLFCHHQTPIGHWESGCPHDIRCMEELKPEIVFEAAKRMLIE